MTKAKLWVKDGPMLPSTAVKVMLIASALLLSFVTPLNEAGRQTPIDLLNGPPYPKRSYWQMVRLNLTFFAVYYGLAYVVIYWLL